MRGRRAFFMKPKTLNTAVKMGMMKRYLENFLHRSSDQQFGQDAVEHAVVSGAFQLTYDLGRDLAALFEPTDSPLSNCCGAPAEGESDRCRRCHDHATFQAPTRYDELCEAYRAECRKNEEVLVSVYESSGLLEEILKPTVPA